MPNFKQVARTSGYLFLLFLVDVAANVVADAMALLSRAGVSHPRSETPQEMSAHPASEHAASTWSVQVVVVVLVALVFVCATGACVGTWFRSNVLDILRGGGDDRNGFREVVTVADDSDDSMISININDD